MAKSRHAHPKFFTTAMTLPGAAVICAAAKMTSH